MTANAANLLDGHEIPPSRIDASLLPERPLISTITLAVAVRHADR